VQNRKELAVINEMWSYIKILSLEVLHVAPANGNASACNYTVALAFNSVIFLLLSWMC